ncbi:hypothetical protein CYLTODRAFT_450008 [Cylindrobasidium torrendii FP15055 ss-10]|uniref:Uncharacterized protein n=1 Tax=Cylindrobasidium torrendii FP15055 ss-10 TaxID=1314674 RepID=A0A0D7BPC8_9AGAR|nr:hypothetical protein CYLTODRAFT_450008 [Cylindrobasidium torrendii FP15055 ss-10]
MASSSQEEVEDWRHLFEIVDGAVVPVPLYRVPGKRPSCIVTKNIRTISPQCGLAGAHPEYRFDIFDARNICHPLAFYALISGEYISTEYVPWDVMPSWEEVYEEHGCGCQSEWEFPEGELHKDLINWWFSTWCSHRRAAVACVKSLEFNNQLRDSNKKKKEAKKGAVQSVAEMLRAAQQYAQEALSDLAESNKRKATEELATDTEHRAKKAKTDSDSTPGDAEAQLESPLLFSELPPFDLPPFDPTYGGSYEPTSPLPLDVSKCPSKCLKYQTARCPCTGRFRKPKPPSPIEVSPQPADKPKVAAAPLDLSSLSKQTELLYALRGGEVACIRVPIAFAEGEANDCACENDVSKDQPRRPVYGALEPQFPAPDTNCNAMDVDAPKSTVVRRDPEAINPSVALRCWMGHKKWEAEKMSVGYYQQLMDMVPDWPDYIGSAKYAPPIWREYRSAKLDPRQEGCHPLRECIYAYDEDVDMSGRERTVGVAEVKMDSCYKVKMSYTTVF